MDIPQPILSPLQPFGPNCCPTVLPLYSLWKDMMNRMNWWSLWLIVFRFGRKTSEDDHSKKPRYNRLLICIIRLPVGITKQRKVSQQGRKSRQLPVALSWEGAPENNWLRSSTAMTNLWQAPHVLWIYHNLEVWFNSFFLCLLNFGLICLEFVMSIVKLRHDVGPFCLGSPKSLRSAPACLHHSLVELWVTFITLINPRCLNKNQNYWGALVTWAFKVLPH